MSRDAVEMRVTGSSFALALCQPGMERALKSEVALARPDLHAAFQRPGLVTFKATGRTFGPDETVPSVFGRVWACSHGRCGTADEVVDVASAVGARVAFVGHRDLGVPGDVPPAAEAAALADEAAWREALAGRLDARPPRRGEVVLDVVTAPGEPPQVGWHVHGPGRHVEPCGRYTYAMPARVPSRAYRKVVEGLRWSGARLTSGDLVLEIGAAPGGGTLALVEAGAVVYALDHKPLDPDVAALDAVVAVQRPVGDLAWDELPGDVRWIACDANIPPMHAVRAVARLVMKYRRGLKGLLLTLKLNDEAAIASLPQAFDALRAAGAHDVRGVQLPSNRGDVFVYAPFRAGSSGRS